MRKTREILRQKLELGRSHREVAASVGLSVGAVSATLMRAAAAGISWTVVQELSDEALDERLYGAKAVAARPMPDCAYLHVERKKAGVTLELLHLEYLEKYPDGYRYTQFCEHYREWVGKRGLTMRQEHIAGEKLYVDYAGKKPHLVVAKSGERIEVELFVAVLGASNYTYAEATTTQRGPDFIASHVRTFRELGGVPLAVVPDELKSGVTLACRYEPGIQRTYEDLARHYGTTVLPARPLHPPDKAKVEVGVQVVERWILARLRNETFFSLERLNEGIAELLVELNDRKMRVYGASRRELFERLDRPALQPLPSEPFSYAEWKMARLNIDYHAEIDHHYYSAPYSLVHEQVEAR
jgi:transposase